MDLISAALPGVVQGLTEFLPVSSSGQLTVKSFVRYLAAPSLEAFAYCRCALAAVTGLWLVSRP